MTPSLRLGIALLVLLLVAPVSAAEELPPEGIAWSKDLTSAFQTAKVEQKILMVCVNAKRVDGKTRQEPAAKGLREVVYKDARIIENSREFVCAFLTPEGTSEEYGELRGLGISGRIVSPQHIFVHPDGNKILLRKQYWSHGKDEKAVVALLDMMAKAQKRLEDGGGEARGDGEETEMEEAPAEVGSEARAQWIREKIDQVMRGSASERSAAIDNLIANDKEGDCLSPILALFEEHKKDVGLLVILIRALGRDGLIQAAPVIAAHLKHREAAIRGNAAVSLEYIGSLDKKVVAAIKAAAGKEKDSAIAGHMYRALGRCGIKDNKARSTLLKKADGAKSEFDSYGPTIALAYFEKDAKAARGVEKILKKIGIPGSRRSGGQNTVKRGVLSWTLAQIGDEKSGDFVREELIAKLKNVQAFWVGPLVRFYSAVANKCDGDESAMDGITAGVGGFVQFAKGANLGRYGAETRGLMDEYRQGRRKDGFTPKGDGLLGGEDE